MSGSARCAALVLGVGLGLVAPGCGPGPSDFFWEEDFESLCAGVPCGWVVGAGPVGSALWVETLPGEHGLALHGDRVAVLGPVDGVEIADDRRSTVDLGAVLAARCDRDASLEIEVSVSDVITGGISSFRGTSRPGTTWSEGPDAVPLVVVGSTSPGLFFRDMVSIRILKSGPGVCEIDAIGIEAEPARR